MLCRALNKKLTALLENLNHRSHADRDQKRDDQGWNGATKKWLGVQEASIGRFGD